MPNDHAGAQFQDGKTLYVCQYEGEHPGKLHRSPEGRMWDRPDPVPVKVVTPQPDPPLDVSEPGICPTCLRPFVKV